MIAVAITVLAAVVGVGVLRYGQRQGHWPDKLPEVRLEPRRPYLPAAGLKPDNGAFYLVQLTNAVDNADDRVRAELRVVATNGWADGTYPALEAWLDQPPADLEVWDRAGRLSDAQMPTVQSVDDLFPFCSPFLALARVVPARAERLAARGEWAAALEVYRGAFANAGHISRGAPLIHYLISQEADRMFLSSLRRLALRVDMPAETRHTLVRLVDDRKSALEPLSEALRYEGQIACGLVDVIYLEPGAALAAVSFGDGETMSNSVLGRLVRLVLRSRLLGLLNSYPAATVRHVEAVFSHVIYEADQPSAYQSSALRQFIQYEGAGRWVSDPMGQILIRLMLPASDQMRRRADQREDDFEATKAALEGERAGSVRSPSPAPAHPAA